MNKLSTVVLENVPSTEILDWFLVFSTDKKKGAKEGGG